MAGARPGGEGFSLSEPEIIRRYFLDRASGGDDVIVGIGDDGAILRPPEHADLVVSVDMLVAEVHFGREASAEDIGYKALAVNLSDLAAMGAEPAWATLALALPAADEGWLDGFSRGFLELARRHGVKLVGGDLTRGPLAIAVGVYGFVPRGTGLRRTGARPGDLVYVTGTLGDAALGLLISQGRAETEEIFWDHLNARLYRPAPRIAEGLALRGRASSAIDLSDGLVSDLGHLLAASGAGATIDIDSLPLSPAVQAVGDARTRFELALAGGDDYELCFTLAPGSHITLESTSAHCIGRIEEQAGLRFVRADGTRFVPGSAGYRHF
jgi:thiamine-monophosphate kinase